MQLLLLSGTDSDLICESKHRCRQPYSSSSPRLLSWPFFPAHYFFPPRGLSLGAALSESAFHRPPLLQSPGLLRAAKPAEAARGCPAQVTRRGQPAALAASPRRSSGALGATPQLRNPLRGVGCLPERPRRGAEQSPGSLRWPGPRHRLLVCPHVCPLRPRAGRAHGRYLKAPSPRC